MIFTTRFRYLLLLVALFIFILLVQPQTYFSSSTQAYLPLRFRPQAVEEPVDNDAGTLDIVKLQGSSPVTRQALWNDVHQTFESHKPSYLDNLQWPADWPTMPLYQMNKEFNREEVIQSSPRMAPTDESAAKELQASLLETMPKWSNYSSLYSGKGYVMTSGSAFLSRVFPIGIQMLHKLGSNLPVEIWTKNEAEFEATNPIVQQLGKDYGLSITCHRFSDYVDISQFPVGYTSNYLMKAMTMLLSSFEEVIMLDADNVPVLNPEPLFSSQEYIETGLILWPDFWSNSVSDTLHNILNIPYTFARTCESGQVVLDKRKHFESLVLANYYNWYGEQFYKLITLDGMGTGDKDTFVVGAQTLGRSFHFTTRPLELLRAAFTNGTQWKEDTSVFNGAMGQFNPLNMSEIMFMHMHSPKLNFPDQELDMDLVFVRSDSPEVYFSPSPAYLEKLIWESLQWVECASILAIKDDPKQVCQKIRARVQGMS